MAVTYSTVGIALAAFGIWLTVRLYNRRQRWSKRMALGIAVAVLLAYPLSIGPVMSSALWLGSGPDAMTAITRFYRPVFSITRKSEATKTAMNWYLDAHTNGRVRQN